MGWRGGIASVHNPYTDDGVMTELSACTGRSSLGSGSACARGASVGLYHTVIEAEVAASRNAASVVAAEFSSLMTHHPGGECSTQPEPSVGHTIRDESAVADITRPIWPRRLRRSRAVGSTVMPTRLRPVPSITHQCRRTLDCKVFAGSQGPDLNRR